MSAILASFNESEKCAVTKGFDHIKVSEGCRSLFMFVSFVQLSVIHLHIARVDNYLAYKLA